MKIWNYNGEKVNFEDGEYILVESISDLETLASLADEHYEFTQCATDFFNYQRNGKHAIERLYLGLYHYDGNYFKRITPLFE